MKRIVVVVVARTTGKRKDQTMFKKEKKFHGVHMCFSRGNKFSV